MDHKIKLAKRKAYPYIEGVDRNTNNGAETMTIITDTKTIARFNQLRGVWGDKAYKGYATINTARRAVAKTCAAELTEQTDSTIGFIKIDSGKYQGRLIPTCILADDHAACLIASTLCRQGILCI